MWKQLKEIYWDVFRDLGQMPGSRYLICNLVSSLIGDDQSGTLDALEPRNKCPSLKKQIIHGDGVEQREKQFTTRILIVSGKEDHRDYQRTTKSRRYFTTTRLKCLKQYHKTQLQCCTQ